MVPARIMDDQEWALKPRADALRASIVAPVRRGFGSVRPASAGILSRCSTAYRGGVSDELDDVENRVANARARQKLRAPQRRRSRARHRLLPDPRRVSAQRAHVRPE